MSKFIIHTLESAPQSSKAAVEKSIKNNGVLPNLHAIMAESSGLLEGYQLLHELFVNSSFNEQELTVVWQTINVEHGCEYCVPAHTGIAVAMKVDPLLTHALRNREKMPTEKLQVLHDTTLLMVRKRGLINDDELQRFFDVGYAQQQLLEIILGLSQKVMSNYTNHVAHTPVDPFFNKYAWKK